MQAPPRKTPPLDQIERVRIIGQGLVGSLLAMKLDDAGVPFVVQDTVLPGAATRVAPGIVNPLAGRNFRPPDNLETLMEELHRTMARLEEKLGLKIWTPCPILRMFADPSQVDRFEDALTDRQRETYVEASYPENTFSELNDVFGSFLTVGGGWADLPLLVESTRDWLEEKGRLVEESWDPQTPPDDDPAEMVVFCEGWQVANNPHWKFIPHNPAKGEMLIVRFEEQLPRDRIYNQSCWVQPYEKNLWRVGATYAWSDFGSNPSLDGANDLQERLHLLTSISFHVLDQLAGVRPIVEDYRPVVGQHPEKPNWHIVNAMGSKGVLQAPAAVEALLANLAEGREIPDAWRVDRFA